MSGLLATDTAVIVDHVFVNVFVANIGLGIIDAQLVKCLVEAEVRHNRRNNCIILQSPLLFKVFSINIEDVVAINKLAVLINRKASVSVAVISKADIQAVVDNELLQALDMC